MIYMHLYAYPQEGDYHLSFRWQVQLDIDNQLFLHVIKFYTHKQNDSIHENIHFEPLKHKYQILKRRFSEGTEFVDLL